MADIRINSLPTTASASSSDDFLALDGTTNGTRKLNAFSPTFGGNLTVSGTGTVNSGLASGSTLFTTYISTDRAINFRNLGSGSDIWASNNARNAYSALSLNGSTLSLNVDSGGATTVGGNLTVSGTGTSSFAGDVTLQKGASSATDRYLNCDRFDNLGSTGIVLKTNGTSDWFVGLRGTSDSDYHIFNFGTSSSALKVVRSTGNLLIGTTTDGGQKLQVSGTSKFDSAAATHTVAQFKQSNASYNTDIDLAHTSVASTAILSRRATGELWLYTGGSDGAIKLYTNSALALTLDSSQNATFAGTTDSSSISTGALKVSGGVGVAKKLYASGLYAKPTSGWATLEAQAPAADTSAAIDFVPFGTLSSSNPVWFAGHRFSAHGPLSFWVYNGTSHENTVFSLANTGNLTIGGSLTTSAPTGGAGAWELGVYTATAPTATGYVTIEIGGTQYKLLAATA